MGLPLRHDKASYTYCLDYKRMGKQCTSTNPARAWTKDEMMAYLDWDNAEDERVEMQVASEMGVNPLANGRRGLGGIWMSVEQYNNSQRTRYTTTAQTGLEL